MSYTRRGFLGLGGNNYTQAIQAETDSPLMEVVGPEGHYKGHPISRRGLLKATGATAGTAALSNIGCGGPREGPDIVSSLTARVLRGPVGEKSEGFFASLNPDRGIFDAYQQELGTGPFERVYDREYVRKDLFGMRTKESGVIFNFDVKRLFDAMNPQWSAGDIAYVADLNRDCRVGGKEGEEGGTLEFICRRNAGGRMILKEVTHVNEKGERRLVYHEMGRYPRDPQGRQVVEIIR